ncbi:Hypothetical protein NTJ_04645 [Nesidiocoris tenuis]|uniref:Uncharacterized protein n=1 Tax=Nesidiocoris tenuis TaxID=355587 RepID=A0ABN7AHV5_9HEMI|nr:Hypothetical protein NTJ_04645 [Nesidiocoris tenuis]
MKSPRGILRNKINHHSVGKNVKLSDYPKKRHVRNGGFRQGAVDEPMVKLSSPERGPSTENTPGAHSVSSLYGLGFDQMCSETSRDDSGEKKRRRDHVTT